MTEEKGWEVRFLKTKDGKVKVVYGGAINLYEFFGVLDIERETLKQRLLESV